ncbi:MAG: hypothetical protein NC396_01735 [Bacteroides sp.]|nr:hypothetical protein [Bacteroides sp.]MCM1085561.1 hypothetical protein [Bacteroides sp.]
MKNRKPHIKPKLSPARKEAIYALPLSQQFRIVHIDEGSGFAVFQHVLVDTEANDYEQVLAVAKAYARETVCAINPVIVGREPVGRAKIFPDITDLANPDLTTEKYGYIDVKSPQRKSNIISNANDACKQHAIAVITDFFLGDTLSIYKAKSITFDIFFGRNIDKNGQRNYTKNEIHWFLGGTLHKLNKPEKN